MNAIDAAHATMVWLQRREEKATLRKVGFGRRDAALAKMVAKNIRDTMPPVLLPWSPKLQQLLSDRHLHLVPIALQENNLTPAPHTHVPPQEQQP